MSDDWRVTATFHEDGAARVLERLHEHVVEKDARKLLGSHVAVSVDGDNVFLYVDTRESASEAERIVREILEREGLSAYVKLDHWHQLAEEWEDQSVPLPKTDAEREAEHEHHEEEETEDSQKSGLASWEVRVECASRGDAVEFEKLLKDEGHAVIRRAPTSSSSAPTTRTKPISSRRRIKHEAPLGAKVVTELRRRCCLGDAT